MEFIIANEGIPQNIGCEGATITYYGSEIEFHYETVPPHGDEIFSAELPLLDIKLPFWMYGRNLIFLDNSAKRLGININEVRRKREGLDGAIHFIPSLLNDDYKFRPINMKTANMITEQIKNREDRYVADTSELYSEDVQLISKDGRLYYLPE